MTTAITSTMTVAEATVRLLLTGNTTDWVLAELGETHPGRGTGNTVAWYRAQIKACRLGKPHKLNRLLATLAKDGGPPPGLPEVQPPRVVPPGTVSPLIASLDTLDLDPEVRKLAEETVRFSQQSPEASCRSGRATLIAVVRQMGARGTLDQAIRDFEDQGKISKVTAIHMRTIQKIRNNVEYESAKITTDDAQICASALVTILKSVNRNKLANHT